MEKKILQKIEWLCFFPNLPANSYIVFYWILVWFHSSHLCLALTGINWCKLYGVITIVFSRPVCADAYWTRSVSLLASMLLSHMVSSRHRSSTLLSDATTKLNFRGLLCDSYEPQNRHLWVPGSEPRFDSIKHNNFSLCSTEFIKNNICHSSRKLQRQAAIFGEITFSKTK